MSHDRIHSLVEQAFDYRGFVTVSRHDGTQLVGFVYDRGPAHVEMFLDDARSRIRIAMHEIADVELTGDDVAAKAHRIWERRKGTLEPADSRELADRPPLILVALPLELRGIARALGSRIRNNTVRGRLAGRGVVARAVGLGGGAAQAIEDERPGLVIGCGFSGALERSLTPGTPILASAVYDELGDSIAAPAALLQAVRRVLDITVGDILCTTSVAATRGEKRALARAGLLAVDLESWPAARAAQQAGIPWLALRVILDPLETDLPAFTRNPHRGYVAAALRHALRGPMAVMELAQLGMRARTATRSIETMLRRLGPALGASGGLEAIP